MEYKRMALESADIKFTDDSRKFSGYASVFGGVDAYNDTIVKGAYLDTLKDRDRPVRMRWNHFGPVIGKYIDLHEDEKGLYFEGELTPKHSVAENVYASLKHGAVDGMSIGYRVKEEETQGDTRLLKKIDLIEISVVEEPADLGAKVGDVKHTLEMMEHLESIKEIESFLREAGGFSRTAAVALIARMQSLSLGEQELKRSLDIQGSANISTIVETINNHIKRITS